MISTKTMCLLAMTAIFLGGCASPAVQQPNDSANAYVPAPTPVSSPAKPAVPPVIDEVGHYSENIYDTASAGDWPGAKTNLTSLKHAAANLPAVNSNGIEQDQLNATIQALDRTITERNRADATREANQITWI